MSSFLLERPWQLMGLMGGGGDGGGGDGGGDGGGGDGGDAGSGGEGGGDGGGDGGGGDGGGEDDSVARRRAYNAPPGAPLPSSLYVTTHSSLGVHWPLELM